MYRIPVLLISVALCLAVACDKELTVPAECAHLTEGTLEMDLCRDYPSPTELPPRTDTGAQTMGFVINDSIVFRNQVPWILGSSDTDARRNARSLSFQFKEVYRAFPSSSENPYSFI